MRTKASSPSKCGRTKRRRPVFTLTPEQVLQRCRENGREVVCAGVVMVVMELMRLTGWSITELAERSRVSESHLSEFLSVRKFFTLHSSRRVARAFRLPLSCVVILAERWLGPKESP
ncbi:MAG: helix-turn-helix transcriptional regulator [Verrucomicrobiaceae bacterium]